MLSIPACIKVFNAKHELVYINAWGIREHFIHSEDEFRKYDHINTVIERDQPRILQAFNDALNGKISHIDFGHVPEKSKHKWCYSTISQLVVSNSEKKYVLFSSVDFTVYKEAEIEAIKQANMFRLLLDSAPLCIKWFNNKGELLSVNKGAREEHFLEGKTEQDIQSWNYWESIDSKYHNDVKKFMHDALVLHKTTSFDMKHAPGTSRGLWCRSVISPIVGADGKVEFVLFLSQDITEQKSYIQKLETLNQFMVDRELKMAELKKEIEILKKSTNIKA